MTDIKTNDELELPRAEAVLDEVKVDENTPKESDEVSSNDLPILISKSVEMKKDFDPSNPLELMKSIFIKFGIQVSKDFKMQLDWVDEILTLTSFNAPTMQFCYKPESNTGDEKTDEAVKKTVFYSGFPADDSVAIVELVLLMNSLLQKYGFELAVSSIIAPVALENGRHSLVADQATVMALSARASYLQGRTYLYELDEAKKTAEAEASKAAETPAETPAEKVTETPAEGNEKPTE